MIFLGAINLFFGVVAKTAWVGTGLSLLYLSMKIALGINKAVVFGQEHPILSIFILITLFLALISIFSVFKLAFQKSFKFFFPTEDLTLSEKKIKHRKILKKTFNSTGTLLQCLTATMSFITATLLLFREANSYGVIENLPFFKLYKVYTLAEKQEWLNEIHTTSFSKIKDVHWNKLIENIPLDTIQNKNALLEILNNKWISMEKEITNPDITMYIQDSLIYLYKISITFISAHPVWTSAILLGAVATGWISLKWYQSLIAEGFRNVSGLAVQHEALAETVQNLNNHLVITDENVNRLASILTGVVKPQIDALAQELAQAKHSLVILDNAVSNQDQAIGELFSNLLT